MDTISTIHRFLVLPEECTAYDTQYLSPTKKSFREKHPIKKLFIYLFACLSSACLSIYTVHVQKPNTWLLRTGSLVGLIMFI